MAEIKCPKCGEVFSVDESDYNEIVKQIKDKTFKEELHERVKNELALKESQFESQRKDLESNNLRKEAALKSEIEVLKGRLNSFETEKKLAVNETNEKNKELISKKDLEILELKNKLDSLNQSIESKVSSALGEKDLEINNLKN